MTLNDETWHRVKAEVEKMLDAERTRLEDPKAGIDATNVSRGRISALKELLALPRRLEALARNVGPA
jgi:hypothetical protein